MILRSSAVPSESGPDGPQTSAASGEAMFKAHWNYAANLLPPAMDACAYHLCFCSVKTQQLTTLLSFYYWHKFKGFIWTQFLLSQQCDQKSLWQNFKSLANSTLQNFELPLVNLSWCWANFICRKWSKLKKNNLDITGLAYHNLLVLWIQIKGPTNISLTI